MTNKIRKGETMDFEEIDELNEEDMNALYNDIVEFGDETNLAGCCCNSDIGHNYGISNRASCHNWCRSHSATCKGWAPNTGSCGFFCFCVISC